MQEARFSGPGFFVSLASNQVAVAEINLVAELFSEPVAMGDMERLQLFEQAK
jgi:hypothetical protein